MEETPLEALERITPTLSDIGVKNNGLGDVLRHEMVQGTNLLWGLHKEDDLAIAKGFMSAESEFPVHVHEGSHEYVFVLSGCMTFHFPDTKDFKTLERGNQIHILPDVAHYVTAQKDTWYVVMTIPADEAFPNVRKS